jgi:hypothetical protein
LDGKVRTLAKTLLIANFIVLIALAGPGSSRELYLVEKRLGIAHVITYSVQAWFVISTVGGCHYFCFDDSIKVRRMASTATDKTRLGALFELDISSHGGVPICVCDRKGGLTPD